MKKSSATPQDKAALLSLGITPDIAQSAVVLTFAKGELLFREGDPAPYWMLLMRGRAKVSACVASGKKLLLYFYSAGAVLGIVELPLGAAASTDVEALEEVCCVALPMQHCARAFAQCPAFAQYIAQQLAQIVLRSSKNAAVNLLSPLRDRLCAYIGATQTDGAFCANYTHLAEMLGVSTRHLHRELRRLCADGLLQKLPRGYRVVNDAALRCAASDCYLLD